MRFPKLQRRRLARSLARSICLMRHGKTLCGAASRGWLHRARNRGDHWPRQPYRACSLHEGCRPASIGRGRHGQNPNICSQTCCKVCQKGRKSLANQEPKMTGSIQNGSSRLLISQVFLPRGVPNGHLQDALRTKCFFRASVPNIALSHRRHGGPSR